MKTTPYKAAVGALFFAVVASVLSPAVAQDAATKKDGLDKFLNMDAKDVETKLTVVQHEIYQLAVATAIVRFNQQYGHRVNLESVEFASGLELIPGYVFTPKELVKGKRYPAIVWIHGGFHDRFDKYYFKLLDEAVSRGFVVIFPEYRGSAGYGEPHFQNSYGSTDVADSLASADFIAKLPYVDPDRIGVAGHSRGGMVTLLAVQKQPKKFKAAVKIAGLVDFVAYMAYKPEYRRLEIAKEAQFGGLLPDKNLGAYMKVSPVNFVNQIQTPLLVISNTLDKSVPIDLHTTRLVELLRSYGKTHETKIYKDAPGGHMFLFADTDEAKDTLKRTFDFFEKYLKP